DLTLESPPLEFEVVEVTEKAVLTTHWLPLEGERAKQPPEEAERRAIQQVAVRGRTFLVFRYYHSQKNGGKPSQLVRLAELPGKVDVKVEGGFGDRKPLFVTYKDATAPGGVRTLKLSSDYGEPWTEGHEEILRGHQKAKSTPAKP
ncbi:MAG: hypothetical protein K2V38_19330, partial [Gemmataceae bacterium]|nr:hypothetical protein [Gemmataceae bacterium]